MRCAVCSRFMMLLPLDMTCRVHLIAIMHVVVHLPAFSPHFRHYHSWAITWANGHRNAYRVGHRGHNLLNYIACRDIVTHSRRQGLSTLGPRFPVAIRGERGPVPCVWPRWVSVSPHRPLQRFTSDLCSLSCSQSFN